VAGAQAGRLAVRTWWFDRRFAEALSGKLSSNAAPRQVVLLGAGMDTRAWRELGFPAGAENLAFDCARGLVDLVPMLQAILGCPHLRLPPQHLSVDIL